MPQSGPPIAVTPELAAIRDQARALHAQGRLAEAFDLHVQALRLAPKAAGIWLSAARLAHSLGRQELSLPYFEQTIRLAPACFPAIDAARRISLTLGLYERAVRYSEMAYELKPDTDILVALKLAVPPIAASLAEIRDTRRRFARGLDEILESTFCLPQPDGVLGANAFYLAYHGQNDRELQAKTARMFAKAIPTLSFVAPHCRQLAPRGERKIRIGFISRFFFSHSIFATSYGLIREIDREQFDVIVLRITPSQDDASTAKLRAAARVLDLDPDVYQARRQIADLALDILFYQDIGMEPTSYFLAFSRLAPVQCVSFGHPNTTGIPAMDYFISNDAYETAGSQVHYSEKLIELRTLPTLAYYLRPARPSQMLTREQLHLPASGALYLCPQTLYKLHPDCDVLLRGILEADPTGVVALIEGQFEEFTDRLKARLAQTLEHTAGRVVFLPRASFPRFLLLLELADVVLDTPHFNGMNSSLEAFAMGTPIVTLPSQLQRGRHTQAMYRAMQILDGVAADAQDYVAIAVRIGTDRVYAADLRERIRAASPVLFENRRVIAEFESFFAKRTNAWGEFNALVTLQLQYRRILQGACA